MRLNLQDALLLAAHETYVIPGTCVCLFVKSENDGRMQWISPPFLVMKPTDMVDLIERWLETLGEASNVYVSDVERRSKGDVVEYDTVRIHFDVTVPPIRLHAAVVQTMMDRASKDAYPPRAAYWPSVSGDSIKLMSKGDWI